MYIYSVCGLCTILVSRLLANILYSRCSCIYLSVFDSYQSLDFNPVGGAA